MFIDLVSVSVRSGNGGDGAVSFHREKYVSAGGPDGGDGGRGGDVVLVVDEHLTTLLDFKYKRKYAAENGEKGGRNNCSGKDAQDLIIRVPRGTVIKDQKTNKIIVDMSNKEKFVLAKGGRGGKGNQHFATATRQVPRFAIPGKPGICLELIFELKLLADVGAVGFPNVGKSTIVSAISNARPKVANYHFTTLAPSLGVVKVSNDGSFVVADIPGLIEGASTGVGLGHDFLRHVERCRILWHVVDVSASEGRDPVADFNQINYELNQFAPELATKPQIVIANKIDIASEEQIESFKRFVKNNQLEVYLVSAATGTGLEVLKQQTLKMLEELPYISAFDTNKEENQELEEFAVSENKGFIINKEEGIFIIESALLVRILNSIDIFDYEALQYFERTLVKTGIELELKKLGIQDGDTVKIMNFDFEFEYVS